MALKKGTKVDRGYSTVAEVEGINYREIADTMTEMGYPMNHSSACNYVLRVMRKFAEALVQEYDPQSSPSQEKIDEIAKSPSFQQAVAELLLVVEMKRRDQR